MLQHQKPQRSVHEKPPLRKLNGGFLYIFGLSEAYWLTGFRAGNIPITDRESDRRE